MRPALLKTINQPSIRQRFFVEPQVFAVTLVRPSWHGDSIYFPLVVWLRNSGGCGVYLSAYRVNWSQGSMNGRIHKLGRRGLMVVALACAAQQSVHASGIDRYWDTNGVTPSATLSGNTAPGTWDTTSTNWTADPTGSSTT